MTDAGWTSGKEVHEIGWYWWEENGLPIKAVQIEKGFTFSKSDGIRRDVMYVVGYGGFLEDKPGRFLGPISPDAYHQGRVAGLVAVKDYLEARAEIVEGAALREVLADNRIKENNERSALAEIHAMQSVIRELEQQAQGARK